MVSSAITINVNCVCNGTTGLPSTIRSNCTDPGLSKTGVKQVTTLVFALFTRSVFFFFF